MKHSNNITDTEKEILSYNSYHLDNPIKLNGWQMVYKEPETKNGFEGQIYQKGNNVVVVYKGTNQIKDFFNSDIPMGVGYSPKQQEDAHNLFLKAQYIYKDKNVNIEVTGHSLGGSMAQIESARTGVQATTFNAYGTGKILKLEGFNSQQIQNMNVKNYGNPKDSVFVSNIEDQPGRTYATNTTLDNDKVYSVNRDYSLTHLKKYHGIEKMDKLEDAVEVTPKIQTKDSQNLYHGYVYKMDDIYKNVNNPIFNNIPMAIPESLRQPSGVPTGQAANFDINQLANMLGIQLPEVQSTNQTQQNSGLFGYTNPLTGSNHIYTREEVGQMSSDEFAKHEKEIDAQTRAFNGTMPTNGDLQREAMTGGGVVYVNSYTRSDGTKVRGYYRSRSSI